MLTQTGRPNSILQPVMPQEIVEIVSAFKGNKSPAFDDISLLIKTVISFIAESLAAVINTPFTQDVFPDTLKIAKVIPVFKSFIIIGQFQYYRPTDETAERI